MRLIQDGGVLGPETIYPVNNGPAFLATGDLNGDRQTDLVVRCLGSGQGGTATSRGSIVVLLGHGDGTFASPVSSPLGSAISRPYWLRLGDLSGDGRLDIACSLGKVFLNDGQFFASTNAMTTAFST